MLKNPPANAGDTGDVGSRTGLGRFPHVGNGNNSSILGKFHGQRNVESPSSWGCKELDTTEQLSTHSHKMC